MAAAEAKLASPVLSGEALALASFVLKFITAQEARFGAWQPQTNVADLTKQITKLPASDPVQRLRKQYRNIAELLEAYSESLAEILEVDGSVLRCRRPPTCGWNCLPGHYATEVDAMFAQIDVAQSEVRCRGSRWALAAERKRAPGVWSPALHQKFGPQFRAIVALLLMATQRRNKKGQVGIQLLTVDLLCNAFSFL
jgi:hypothetical protein